MTSKFLGKWLYSPWELFVLWIERILGYCFALGGKPLEKDTTPSPMVRLAEALRDTLLDLSLLEFTNQKVVVQGLHLKGKTPVSLSSLYTFCYIQFASSDKLAAPKSDAWVPRIETCLFHVGQRNSALCCCLDPWQPLRAQDPNGNKGARGDIQ